MNFAKTDPNATIVSSAKALAMMQNFFGTDFACPLCGVGKDDFSKAE